MKPEDIRSHEDLVMYLVGGEDTPVQRARIKAAMQFKLLETSPEGFWDFECKLCQMGKRFTTAEAFEPMAVEKWYHSHLQLSHPRLVLS